MTEILNSGFGSPESAAEQAAALERLRFVMNQLPDLAVPIRPPDELDPIVINVRRANAVAMWSRLRWQIDVIKAQLELAAAAQVPTPDSVREQITRLMGDVAALQNDLARDQA